MIKLANGPNAKAKVTFVVEAELCDEPVSVVGDFNDWDPLQTPLRMRSNGTRSAAVELEAGTTYLFKYLAEGAGWFCDPTIPQSSGETANSILEL